MKLNAAQAKMIQAIAENINNRVEGKIDDETRADETTIALNEVLRTTADRNVIEDLEEIDLVLLIRRNRSDKALYAAEDEIRLTDLGLFIYQSNIANRSAA